MQRVFVMVVAVVLVLGLVVPAFAWTPQDNWFMGIKPLGLQSMGAVFVGTQTGALDGDDSTISNWDSKCLPALDHTLELDVVGDQLAADGRWVSDFRAPLAGPGSKIWTLKAYMNTPMYSTNTFSLSGWMVKAGGELTSPDVRICLYDGNLTVDQCLSATPLWTVTKDTAYGTERSTTFRSGSFTLASADDSHYFTVMEQMSTPEPGSLMAMIGGLLGLVGFGIRRRR